MSRGIDIVWDPALDGGCWPGPLGPRPAVVGEEWLGPLGLLGRLETELGLGGRHPSGLERAGHLADTLDTRTGWWRASFDADPLGACQRLLHDRDTLALWGWHGEPAGERLDGLWSATADALPGIPDRLRAVTTALLASRPDIDTLTTLSPVSALEPAWSRLFAHLAASGVAVTERALATAPASGDLAHARTTAFVPAADGSLTLLRPHGPLAAADEIAASLAARPSHAGVLLIGADAVLDAALARHGLPRLGAPQPAPASAALIRLVVEAAFEPIEPSFLHALLCLDPGPIPRPVATHLIGALAEFPGRRSPLWQPALAAGLAECDALWRAEAAARCDALLMPAATRDARIDASAIARRLQIVATWARTRSATSPTLASVACRAEDARAHLARRGDQPLSLVALRRLCDEFDGGHALPAPADTGLAAVAHPGAVLGPARSIVWWGFTRDSAPLPGRLRLSRSERASLLQHGVTPPDEGRLMEAEAARWRRPLEQATESLVLVCPATSHAGEPCFPHPLWDELRATLPRAESAALLETDRLRLPAPARRSRVAARALPAPTPAFNTGAAIALREEYESPSSLEVLLGCSLRWALHYRGKLRAGRSTGPGAPSPLLYGKLAHHLLALVFEDGALGADAAATRAQSLIDGLLASVCESLGLPRYQAERTAVQQAILQTARALGALLEASGARVAGVEKQLDGRLAGLDVRGRVDLLLAGPDVVIDLKWGTKTARDKLDAGSALQLATYAELLASHGTRPEVAYFTLQNQELLGQPGSALPGVAIRGTASARDTWAGALTALAARRAELADGDLFAPAADPTGPALESRLVGTQLLMAPECGYCDFGVLCGRSRCL